MARRKSWGLPILVLATLVVGVASGALVGLKLRQNALTDPPQATIVPVQPEPEAIAPIQPEQVHRLSAVQAASSPVLLAHLYSWSGAVEPAAAMATAYAALTQCATLLSASPMDREVILAAARAQLIERTGGRRARFSVSIPNPPSGDRRLALPPLTEALRLRVPGTPASACAAAYSASGQPTHYDIRVVGPAPWPSSQEIDSGKGELGGALFGALFGDLVVDLGEPAPQDSTGGVMLTAHAVALYLWSDENRQHAVAALGYVAPDSQDAPAVAVVAPTEDGAPLAGKPVSADLARRAAQTSAIPLPPISTAPRLSVETRSLPPPAPIR